MVQLLNQAAEPVAITTQSQERLAMTSPASWVRVSRRDSAHASCSRSLAEALSVTVLGQKPGSTVQAIEATLECSGPQAWNPLLRAVVDLHALGKLGVIESWLMSLLQQRPADELLTIEALIPERSVALSRIAVALGERQLQAMPVAPGADAARARILNNLGYRYSDLGRREEALGAAERAAKFTNGWRSRTPTPSSRIWRQASTTWATATVIWGGGRRRWARRSGRRRFTSGWRSRTPPPSSRTWRQASTTWAPYGELGRREKALGAAERAVAIGERLAKQNPDAFEPDLATSLNKLGGCCSDLGRREEALGAAERAVAIRERCEAEP